MVSAISEMKEFLHYLFKNIADCRAFNTIINNIQKCNLVTKKPLRPNLIQNNGITLTETFALIPCIWIILLLFRKKKVVMFLKPVFKV